MTVALGLSTLKVFVPMHTISPVLPRTSAFALISNIRTFLSLPK